MVAHTFSHSTQEIEADEFQANPVYIVSSRVARLYSKDLSLSLSPSFSLSLPPTYVCLYVLYMYVFYKCTKYKIKI